MTLGQAPTFGQVDLTNCDREPIHIPGSIQPHGVLLTLREPELTITRVSANSATWLGRPPGDLLGTSFATILDPTAQDALRAALDTPELEQNPLYLLTCRVAGRETPFHCIAHRAAGDLILELEPARDGQAAAPELYPLLRRALAQLQAAAGLAAFCQQVVEAVSRFTGFERVMVYRFADDGHGEVLAEAIAPGLEPYLGLHYPASDIPQQARALYLRNWLRAIPDARYTPVPLLGLDDPAADAPAPPLDMSYCALRSVSPLHLQYLHNMGTRSSMSISLIKDGQLWGLIACHHESGPRFLPYDVRAACEFLGQAISLQIGAKEATGGAEERARLAEVRAALVEQLAGQDDWPAALLASRTTLANYLQSDGVAFTSADICQLDGQTPGREQVMRLTEWLAERGDDLFATDHLAALYPEAAEFAAAASGALAIAVSRERREYLWWFRREIPQTVEWGGDPRKPVVATPDGLRLEPRGSFARWRETVLQRALPWQPVEIEAARELRRALVEVIVQQLDALARLNAELARSNVDLDAFAYIASHDLKEPLRGIHFYAQFMAEDYGERLDDEGRERLATLVRLSRRMEDLIDSLLLYSRVGRTELAVANVDLNATVHDVLDALQVQIAAAGVEVRIPRPLPTVRADRMRIGEVYHNLISNAIKYNDKPEKWVALTYDTPAQGGEPILRVTDNGIGVRAGQEEAIFGIFRRLHGRDQFGGGTGVGLTIARKLVERHGGRIWVESTPGQGASFSFTLGS